MGPPTLNCPGSFDDPRALPGQLCLYERLRMNVSDFQVLNSAGNLSVADTTGVVLAVQAAGAGGVAATGGSSDPPEFRTEGPGFGLR